MSGPTPDAVERALLNLAISVSRGDITPSEHARHVRAALSGSSTAPLDVERLARALRDWEARRHPVPSPDDDDGPHVWDAWIAEARKLAAAASPDPAQPDRAVGEGAG